MNVRRKLLLCAVLLTAVPSAVVGLVGAWTAGGRSHEAMQEQVRDQLVAVREMTASRIETYFERIHKQVRVLSGQPVTVDALRELTPAVQAFGSAEQTVQREALAEYYRDSFGRAFSERNPGAGSDAGALLGGIDATAVAMQYRYIRQNPHPLGSKHRLDSAADGSIYDQVHARAHPIFRTYLEEFGYYDIFLVEPRDGRVVYSVFKELDFGTSLRNGPYARSGLGEAFRRAIESGDPQAVIQTDYSVYRPSYDDQAAFVASPVAAGGEVLGVLIFQMPIDRIDEVMTNGGRWAEVGLGASGETYLVGPDGSLRNRSRFQIENPQGYLAQLRESGMAPALVERIGHHNSGIGLQQVETEGARAALRGETGFASFEDYRKVPVLSAYAPVAIPGLKWGILAEIDRAEAFAAAERTVEDIVVFSALTVAAMMAIGAFAGYLFAAHIGRPVTRLTEEIRAIGRDADLTRHIDIRRKDEIGHIADELNGMFRSFREVVSSIGFSSGQLSGAAAQLSAVTEQSRSTASLQQTEADQMATAVEQMAATSKEVAHSAGKASDGARVANAAVDEGRAQVSATHDAIQDLACQMQAVETVVTALKADSEAIGSVVDVIRSVAEQTNLLALNAAIEAARAGEQGRGFAVVADEVRTLASRTRRSTEEIQQMIERLQSGADNVVRGMGQSREKSDLSVSKANQADDALTRIAEAIATMSDMNHQIAGAAEEQSAVTTEVSASVHAIARGAADTTVAAQQTAAAGEGLNRMADELHHLVRRFKV